MATIVNNPSGTSEDSSAGVVIGIVIALLIIVLFFAFALPYIRNTTPGVPNTGSTDGGASANIDISLPSGNSGSPDSSGSNSY